MNSKCPKLLLPMGQKVKLNFRAIEMASSCTAPPELPEDFYSTYLKETFPTASTLPVPNAPIQGIFLDFFPASKLNQLSGSVIAIPNLFSHLPSSIHCHYRSLKWTIIVNSHRPYLCLPLVSLKLNNAWVIGRIFEQVMLFLLPFLLENTFIKHLSLLCIELLCNSSLVFPASTSLKSHKY